jgi:Na+/H+ antiporter NhaD/arsenite permease-like protein
VANELPSWTLLPFLVLVAAMAVLPLVAPKLWERRSVQAWIVLACALPVTATLFAHGRSHALADTTREYVTFIVTLGALFVSAGGVYATADLEATPRTNTAFLVGGSLLASIIGTTGASVLLIRPLLRTNSQRAHTAHLVPFFILSVANAGGLLTPLGDPPLLVGFARGVPFFWTLQLFPVWALYVGWFALLFYFVDRRAYARERPSSKLRDAREKKPFEISGYRNVSLLVLIVGAAFLPPGPRELAMLLIAVTSYFLTSREIREKNEFSLRPFFEVALLFAGLFFCLEPVEEALSGAAPGLPLKSAWQLFWASGLCSAVLDNAPTYAAFSALAQGLSQGQLGLVAGVTPLKLAAVSIGSVVMGATTYIGNAPNWMLKSIAERSGQTLPSFPRFALFSFLCMLPPHLVVSAVLASLE